MKQGIAGTAARYAKDCFVTISIKRNGRNDKQQEVLVVAVILSAMVNVTGMGLPEALTKTAERNDV